MDTAGHDWSERWLRDAACSGDEEAWCALYERSFDPLYAYVYTRCRGEKQLCDDVVQECWLVAVRRIADFEPQLASFSTWLCGIATNVLRNHYRRKGLSEDLQASARLHDGEIGSGEGDPSTLGLEVNEHIDRVMLRLPERYQAVLWAKYGDELTVDAIAARWRETPKAIESLLTRARSAFRAGYDALHSDG